MKKIVSIFLAVLMILTCFSSIAAVAVDGVDYVIIFRDDNGDLIESRVVEEGGRVIAPDYPTKKPTEDTEYIFKGWIEVGKEDDAVYYHQNTIPNATKSVTYKAVYSEQKIEDGFTFFSFIKSIFVRINIIFEYFSRIFNIGTIK